jgi:hypothetical protein
LQEAYRACSRICLCIPVWFKLPMQLASLFAFGVLVLHLAAAGAQPALPPPPPPGKEQACAALRMQGVLAAWKRPFAAQLLYDNEKTKAKMLLWVSNRRPAAGAPYNVFDSAAIAALVDGGNGRPNLQSLCEVAELADLLLDLPKVTTHLAVRQLLSSVHVNLHLRRPLAIDDEYWLTFQAKRLLSLRSKLLFTKQYPARVLHRVTLLSPEQLVTLATIVSKMDWIVVSEPVLEPMTPAFEALSDLAQIEDAAAPAALQPQSAVPVPEELAAPATLQPRPAVPVPEELAAPATPQPQPAVPVPEEHAMEDLFSPLRLYDEIGIPSIFAVETPGKEEASAKEDASAIPPIFLEEEDDEWGTGTLAQLQAHSLAPPACALWISDGERPQARPIHAGAVQKHFLKKPAGSMQHPTKKPAGSMQKTAGNAPTKKPAGNDSVIRVRYTHPLTPPRTYVCALLGDPPRLKHVLTVTAREHPRHYDIVHRVGEALRTGKVTLEEARRTKDTMYANWPR